MAEEDIRVVHIPGIQNHLADLLSRNGNPAYNRMQRAMQDDDHDESVDSTTQSEHKVPNDPSDHANEGENNGNHLADHSSNTEHAAATLNTDNDAFDASTHNHETQPRASAPEQQNATTDHRDEDESEDSEDSSLFSSDISSYQYSDDEDDMSYENAVESLATTETRQVSPPRTLAEQPEQFDADEAPSTTPHADDATTNTHVVHERDVTANNNMQVSTQRNNEATYDTNPQKRAGPPQPQPPRSRQKIDTTPPRKHVARSQWDTDASPARKRTRHDAKVAHTRQRVDRLNATTIRPSTIPWAGRGLFAARAITKGERVARYGGEPLTCDEAARRHSRYKLQIHANLVLDAKSEQYDNLRGKFINDGKINGRKPNVRFSATRKPAICPDTGQLWISVVAIANIPKGAELFADYGPLYGWKRHHIDKKRAVIDTDKTEAIIQAQTSGNRVHISSILPTIHEHDHTPTGNHDEPEQPMPDADTHVDAQLHEHCELCHNEQNDRTQRAGKSNNRNENQATGRQFLIIKPDPPKIDNTLLRGENDLTGQHMMPDRQDINVPTAKIIATTQKQVEYENAPNMQDNPAKWATNLCQ